MHCEPATYVSSMSSEDPGLLTVSTAMAKLPNDAMSVTFNIDGKGWDSLSSDLPVSIAKGREECLRYCSSMKY